MKYASIICKGPLPLLADGMRQSRLLPFLKKKYLATQSRILSSEYIYKGKDALVAIRGSSSDVYDYGFEPSLHFSASSRYDEGEEEFNADDIKAYDFNEIVKRTHNLLSDHYDYDYGYGFCVHKSKLNIDIISSLTVVSRKPGNHFSS